MAGVYPVAQVQEPYSVVKYLAERVPIEVILNLSPPLDEDEDEDEDKDKDASEIKDYGWSAWDVCEGNSYRRATHSS